MSDFEERSERTPSGLFAAGLVLAVLASVGALIWSYNLSSRLSTAEQSLAVARQQNDKLSSDLTAQLQQTNSRLATTSETLGQSVGLTQQRLEMKTTALTRAQRADAQRLEKQQMEARQQIGAVSTDVASVKTDVTGVKTDVAKTQSDLQTTQTQLQSMKGDLGLQSGLIATNHDELEVLRHKGDRNYYEFTLNKSGKPQPVSTISLELKKVDVKHNRYTLQVIADDKKIDKKDKGLNEPVQFYTGKSPMLFELVVNSINKNQIVGYVSAPKNAPQAIAQ